MVILEKDWIKQVSYIGFIFFLVTILRLKVEADIVEDVYCDTQMSFLCAQNANTLGLNKLAEEFYIKIFESNNTLESDKVYAQNCLLDLYIMKGEWDKADKFIKNNVFDNSVATRFRSALVLFMKNNFRECETLLSSFEENSVSKNDLGLYYTLCGMMSLKISNTELANKYFSAAEYVCENKEQLLQIQVFAFREMLRFDSSMNNNLNIVKSIEQAIETNGFEKIPNSMIKELVIAYMRVNQPEKAKKILEQKLAAIPTNKETENEKLSFHLFFALACGLNSDKGIYFIHEFLTKSTEDPQKNFAITFLIENAKTNEAKKGLIDFFDQILHVKTLSAKFRKHLMLAKIKLSMDVNDTNLAQKTAEEIIAQFATDSNKEEVLEFLAYLSWVKEPKEYRMMANYFEQLKTVVVDPKIKAVYTQKIADCYFLNGDFVVASKLYEEMFNNAFIDPSSVLSKQIAVDMKLGNFDAAIKHLEVFDAKFATSSDDRWNVEFELMQLLLANNQHSKVANLLEKIINNREIVISPLLRVKFYLMHAQMMFEQKQFHTVIKTTKNMKEIFDKRGQSKEISDIVAQVIYLQFKSEESLGNIQNFNSCFDKLRSDYQLSIYTQMAYFEQANYLSAVGSLDQAIVILKEFVDKYTDSDFTKHAKFQIACYLKNIGFAKYDDAIKYFEEIINKYGNDEITYQARLEEANILRLQGKFGSAQLIYEHLLNTVPTDKRYDLTRFYLSKCLVAQHNKNKSFLENGIVELSKLYNSRAIDNKLHLEVSIEYCLALKISENYELLNQVCMGILTRHFISDSMKTFSANEIFWMKQLLFLLKQTLEESNDNSDLNGLNNIIRLIEQIKY